MDRLPRVGKRELICLLLFTCNYVVSVWRGLLFLWVLGMGYVILLWHSLSLPYVRPGSAQVFSLSESGVDQLILLHHSGSITQKGVLETDKRMYDSRTTSFKNIHNDMKHCSIKHTCHKY